VACPGNVHSNQIQTLSYHKKEKKKTNAAAEMRPRVAMNGSSRHRAGVAAIACVVCMVTWCGLPDLNPADQCDSLGAGIVI